MLDHGASNGVWLSSLHQFHGFFELAVGFFHDHGNVDRSFLTFRARLTIIFSSFQLLLCPVASSLAVRSDNNSCVTRQNFSTVGPYGEKKRYQTFRALFLMLSISYRARTRIVSIQQRTIPPYECASTIVLSYPMTNISSRILFRSPRREGCRYRHASDRPLTSHFQRCHLVPTINGFKSSL